jgi:hypothetical protein
MELTNAIRKPKTSQKQRITKAIEAIKNDVTAVDRKECLKALGISEPSLKNYMSGKIGNNDTAVKILKYLKERIAEREKAITA